VQAYDYAEGGFAPEGNPHDLADLNGIAYVRRHGVAEQVITARPRARDGDIGNRHRWFRSCKGVLRHATSLLVRRIRLACPCVWHRGSLCCRPPVPTGDP
jgi:hypothetical protein